MTPVSVNRDTMADSVVNEVWSSHNTTAENAQLTQYGALWPISANDVIKTVHKPSINHYVIGFPWPEIKHMTTKMTKYSTMLPISANDVTEAVDKNQNHDLMAQNIT